MDALAFTAAQPFPHLPAVAVPTASMTSALAQPQPSSAPPSAQGLALGALGGMAAAAFCRRQRRSGRGRTTLQLAPRAETEAHSPAIAVDRPDGSAGGVVQMAQDANVKLDIRPWEFLSGIAKDAARGWFVKRAEERGIQWTESVKEMKDAQLELDRLYKEICNPNLKYPAYYLQPFHGYDQGNLNWNAAHELKPATESMGLGYYEGMTWEESQDMYRGAARGAIAEKWAKEHKDHVTVPKKLLDIGCSGGYSTHQMAQVFPGVHATGVDLSPHFLAVAALTYPDLDFVHGRAEDTDFQDGEFDVATFNYILHECPKEASIEALREAWRVLKPGGMVAVLDVEPKRLLELPPFRRWAFQVTEPWCKDGEYYSLDVAAEMENIGFEFIEDIQNDPVNHLVLAMKPL